MKPYSVIALIAFIGLANFAGYSLAETKDPDDAPSEPPMEPGYPQRHGPSSYGSGYRRPGYGYGPSYQQHPYGAFYQPHYGPSYQPHYGPSYQTPYQPAYGDGYSSGGYDQKDYDQEEYGNAGYKQTNYGSGGYKQTDNGYGGYNQAGYGFGGYNQPGYGFGGYNQPGYGLGGYNQPGYGYGGYNQPGYGGYKQVGYGGYLDYAYDGYKQNSHPQVYGTPYPIIDSKLPGYGPERNDVSHIVQTMENIDRHIKTQDKYKTQYVNVKFGSDTQAPEWDVLSKYYGIQPQTPPQYGFYGSPYGGYGPQAGYGGYGPQSGYGGYGQSFGYGDRGYGNTYGQPNNYGPQSGVDGRSPGAVNAGDQEEVASTENEESFEK